MSNPTFESDPIFVVVLFDHLLLYFSIAILCVVANRGIQQLANDFDVYHHCSCGCFHSILFDCIHLSLRCDLCA